MLPTPEEKQYILELVQELKEYVRDLPKLAKEPKYKREMIADRMIMIKDELQYFRRKYPDA